MNHELARLLIGGEPHEISRELGEHLASCPECSQFQRETVDLDHDIRRALERSPLPVPVTVRQRKYTRARSGWALAASVALLTVLAIWALRPNESLAHEVVQHVQLESGSWTTDEHVTPEEMTATLALAGVELDRSSGKVMYAHRCPFRGHIVPHLVVSTAQGRATVLVLRYESVRRRTTFEEGAMSGVIVPATRGSIAVLMQGKVDVYAVIQQIREAVHWRT